MFLLTGGIKPLTLHLEDLSIRGIDSASSVQYNIAKLIVGRLWVPAATTYSITGAWERPQ